METEPAPSGGGRLPHHASSAEFSLFLGVAGDSPPGHPSTFNIKQKVWLMFILLITDNRTHLQRLRVPNSPHPVDQFEHRSPVRAPVTGLFTRGLVRRDTYSGQTVVMVSSFSIVRKRAHYPGSRSHLQPDVLVVKRRQQSHKRLAKTCSGTTSHLSGCTGSLAEGDW